MPLRLFHEGARFSLLLYERSGGDSPFTEFLRGLTRKDRARLTGLLEKVADHGPLYSPERSVPLTGQDFLEFKSGQQRIFWCYAPGRRIVLMHGFTKKSNQTPRRELRTGARLREEVRDEIGE